MFWCVRQLRDLPADLKFGPLHLPHALPVDFHKEVFSVFQSNPEEKYLNNLGDAQSLCLPPHPGACASSACQCSAD